MSFQSRGRPLVEVIIAVVLIGFVIGFVGVLCIGNYYRAMKAMERQRQRRLARSSLGGDYDSPAGVHSHPSSDGGEGTPILFDNHMIINNTTERPTSLRQHPNHRKPPPIIAV